MSAGAASRRVAWALWAAGALSPALVALAGCGGPSADLFLLRRSGTIEGAALVLLVKDGGTVRCNGGPERKLSDAGLLDAREIVTQLGPAARRRVKRPPGPNAVLRYHVTLEAGEVAFSDTSTGKPSGSLAVQAFTRKVAIGVCGLAR